MYPLIKCSSLRSPFLMVGLATMFFAPALAQPNWPTEPSRLDDLGNPAPLLPTPPARRVLLPIDSGPVLQGDSQIPGRALRWSIDLAAPDSDWVRVVFDHTELSGDPNAENGAMLRIVSLADGAEQFLTAESLQHWSGVSAIFNGDTVRVELWSDPAAGPSRLQIAGLYASERAPRSSTVLRDICGPDLRVLSFDNRAARLSSGCTVWVFNDLNRQFLTAGHCGPAATASIQFNVPLSTATGTTVAPPPQDQYPVDAPSIQRLSSGVGSDWSYFAVLPNSNTGLLPFQAYGMHYTLAAAMPPLDGRPIRITGFGTVSSPVDRTWNQAQKTHVGPLTAYGTNSLRYQTNTTGGNSGSAVLSENDNLVVGVHSHAGCSSGGNQGTQIMRADLQAALRNPRGNAGSGVGTVSGNLFALGDLNNNFGTVSLAPNRFARIARFGSRWQGMAYSTNDMKFFAIDQALKLWLIDVAGNHSEIGTVSGTTQTLTGLAFDTERQLLYAMATTTGQLVEIPLDTLAVRLIGSPSGSGVRALEFDPGRNQLFGLETVASTVRLVRIDRNIGSRVVVGTVGAGLQSAGDLAYWPQDGTLRTINPSTGELVRIDPLTGLGSNLGPTSGRFGGAYGLATQLLPLGACCTGFACALAAPADCTGRFNGIYSTCDPSTLNPVACCPANFDRIGGVAVPDIFAFLVAWFNSESTTDTNASGSVEVADILTFLTWWFGGC